MPTSKQYINLLAAFGVVLTILGTVLRAAVGYASMHTALFVFGSIVVLLSVAGVIELCRQHERTGFLDPNNEVFGPRTARCALFGVAGAGILGPHIYPGLSVLAGFGLAIILLLVMEECSSPRKYSGGFALMMVYAGISVGSIFLAVGPYEDLKSGIVGLLAVGFGWVCARLLIYERQPLRQVVA